MSIVYLLKNQHNQYLERSGEWAPPESSKSLFRTEFKDEAINRKVEFSVKNVSLRLAVVEAKQETGGKLVIAEDDLPPIALTQEDETPTISEADSLPYDEDNSLEDEALVDGTLDQDAEPTAESDLEQHNPEQRNPEQQDPQQQEEECPRTTESHSLFEALR